MADLRACRELVAVVRSEVESVEKAKDGTCSRTEFGDGGMVDADLRNAIGRGDDSQSGPAGASKSQAGSLRDAQPPSGEVQSVSPHQSSSRFLIGCLVPIVTLIVGILALFAWFVASLHPQAGPGDRAYARKTAQAAAEGL